MDSPELLKKKTSGSQSDSAKSAARTEHVDTATSGLPRIDGRLSDSVYGENRRGEAFGYITQRQGKGRDTAVNQASVIQREPVPGPLDRLIDTLSAEKAGELFWVRFDGRGVDASVSAKGVGSLYFANGRFRLIHKHGPQISLKEHIRRFAVRGNGEKLKAEIDICKKMSEADSINYLKSKQGYVMEEIFGENFPEGALMELFFSEGKLTGSHPSRGSLERYEINPLGNSGAEKKGGGGGAEDKKEEPKEGKVEEAERQKRFVERQQGFAMKIGQVVAASQIFGERVAQIIDQHTVNGSKGYTRTISDAVNNYIDEISGGDVKVFTCLQTIADNENIKRAIWEASEEAQITSNDMDKNIYRKRLQGYFANQFFHASGIADRMGLTVEPIDKLSESKKRLETIPEEP